MWKKSLNQVIHKNKIICKEDFITISIKFTLNRVGVGIEVGFGVGDY